LQAILDAYEQDDDQKLQALFYCDPATENKMLGEMETASQADLAAYRLRKTAVSHFGTAAMDLNTRTNYLESIALDMLARVGPEDLVVQGESVVLTPPTTLPGWWQTPLYFRQVGGTWKLDIGQSLRISHRVIRREPIPGETEEQAFAAREKEMAGRLNTITDEIGQGKIGDVAGVQAEIDRIFADMGEEYVRMGVTIGAK
jgi:hypothetical protein